MNGILDSIGSAITTVSDFVCGYPLFILLIGGGLFLFFYSGAVSLRRIGYSIKALRYKSEVAGEGQISSFQALMSAIASTVGMGNIAGVAIAITVGGPGAIFWMWVSAVVGMSTKFFEGALAIMYKGHDSAGEPQGGDDVYHSSWVGRTLETVCLFLCGGGVDRYVVCNASQSVGRVCHYGIYYSGRNREYTRSAFCDGYCHQPGGRGGHYRWHPAHFGYLG